MAPAGCCCALLSYCELLLFCLFYSLSKCFYGFICFSWPPFLSSVFGKQLLSILPTLPSPLISFVLSMMKLSKSIHYMEYELMIKNLWETWHHYQSPLHYLLISSLLWCLDDSSSWSNDDWHISKASTTATTRFLDLLLFFYLPCI